MMIFDRPIEEWTLGEILNYCDHRDDCASCPLAVHICGNPIEDWFFTKPQMTQDELDMCSYLDATYITRSKDSPVVSLWSGDTPPKFYEEFGTYRSVTNRSKIVASINAEFFPSVKECTCIKIDNYGKKNEYD